MRRADEADFETFVHARALVLLRVARVLVGDPDNAEDLLQTTLERVARRWHRIDGDPEGYARRTMTNLAVDGWRARARRPVEVFRAPPEAPSADEGRADDGRLRDALLALPVRQRTVLVLRYYEDLTEAEIAARMGVSAGTVKSTAARALKRLSETASPPRASPPTVTALPAHDLPRSRT